MYNQISTAIKTETSNIYKVTEPFPLVKVASTLRKQCKENQVTDKYNHSFITITGTNSEGYKIDATFNTRHIINAFECVGAKATGFLLINPTLFNGMAFLLVEQSNHSKDLNNGLCAIVLQSGAKTLFQNTTLGYIDKVQIAIKRLKAFEPKDGYYLAFSGGKDSQCIYHLAKMAGVKFDAHYSVTTVDPPELIYFIREHYPDVQWEYPIGKDGKRTSMWKIIAEHTIPPTRMSRYCCDILKEQNGKGRVTVTGVRWAESIRRRDQHGVVNIRTSSKKLINEQTENNPSAQLNRSGSLIFMNDNEETKQVVEHCFRKKRTTLNPIIDWSENDVWEFLNEVAKVPHCRLYDEGFTRLGCIGCPLQGRDGMLRDFERWPKYKELYIKAFDRMIANHPGEIRIALGQYALTGGRNNAQRMDRMVWDTNETPESPILNQPKTYLERISKSVNTGICNATRERSKHLSVVDHPVTKAEMEERNLPFVELGRRLSLKNPEASARMMGIMLYAYQGD